MHPLFEGNNARGIQLNIAINDITKYAGMLICSDGNKVNTCLGVIIFC